VTCHTCLYCLIHSSLKSLIDELVVFPTLEPLCTLLYVIVYYTMDVQFGHVVHAVDFIVQTNAQTCNTHYMSTIPFKTRIHNRLEIKIGHTYLMSITHLLIQLIIVLI
jgi:hypothetical protein